jgi:DNA-binding NarL/FixJ family response regulator
MSRPRIVLADDHALFLSGLKLLLEPECDVLATVSDGIALIDAVERLRPDIAIVDIAMPLLNGMEALRQIHNKARLTRFIFLTGNLDVTIATQAFRLGAKGFVLKQSAAEELIAALRAVKLGQTYISPFIANEVLQNLMSHPGKEDGTLLTFRERQVLQLLAEGKSMKEAAALLNVSSRTVEFHRNNIAQKTGLRTIAELSRYASREGMV